MNLALLRGGRYERGEALQRPGEQNWSVLQLALEKFRALDLYPSDIFDALEEEFKAQAGALKGVWNLNFIHDLYASLEEALARGLSAREWLPEASKLIKAYGGTTNLGVFGPSLDGDSLSAWYADLVFRQNVMNALAAGRYAQMFFGPAFEESPYWLYATAMDDRVRPSHAALEGKVFSKIDAEGRRFLPPWDFGCRCQAIELDVIALRAGGYQITSGASITARPREGFNVDRLELVPAALRRAA